MLEEYAINFSSNQIITLKIAMMLLKHQQINLKNGNTSNTEEINNTSSGENNNTPENTSSSSTPVEKTLATFSTKIYSKDSARQNNIKITCNSLNNTTVKNGSTFSFCNTVGQATSAKGYQKADIFDKDGNKKIKYMPNPNVMLELGYATHVVGWDRVICVLNSDFGAPENMPFDIASRRLTPFSLKDGKSKGEIKRYIKSVIQDTVENVLEKGKRVKSGFSNLRIGSYDDGVISDSLNPYEVSKASLFIKHKGQILEECAVLLEKIKKIGIPNPSELHIVEEENDSSKDVLDIIREDGTVLTPIKNSFKLNLFQRHRVNIKDEDKKAIIDLAKKYLNVDLSCDRDFFDFGNLEVQPELLGGTSYDGTQEEKDKHNKITELEYSLHRVQMMDWYVTTFDGMLFLPLAIENVSTVYDEDVDILFSVKGNVDIIRPSKKLIKSEMQGLEGLIYEEDIIKELLLMPETADISYDTDISYNINDSLAESQAAVRAQFSGAGINGNPRYNSDDYGREISKYIAIPITDSEIEFSVGSLRAREKKWLGPALLISSSTEKFDIEYTIKSKHSDGNLSGIITYTK